MSENSEGSKWKNLSFRDFASYLIAIFGAFVFFAVAYSVKNQSDFWYDLARDIGMAFVVALVVTTIYELYARRRYERKQFIVTLEQIMGDFVDDRVWEAVRDQVFERTVIREKTQITLSLEEEKGLAKGQMVLCVAYNYELHSLKSRSVQFRVQHYLDNHIQCQKNHLPRFEQIEIGTKNYSGDNLRGKIKDGIFSSNVTLKPRRKGCVMVRTKRKEIIYVPGSYGLVLNEICADVRINLDKLPPCMVAHVRGPNAAGPVSLEVGPTLDDFEKKILLPGQAFEFQFIPEKEAVVDLPLFPVHPRPQAHYIEIVSPAEGANVQDNEWIKGTANLPGDSFLWIFIASSASPDEWRPQGGGVVVIKNDRQWEVLASYGQPGETGTFKIVATAVDDTTNRQLQKDYAAAAMQGRSMPLPPVDERLTKIIEVKKPTVQLDRVRNINEASRERRVVPERRGRVLAVNRDRRTNSADRRGRKAG